MPNLSRPSFRKVRTSDFIYLIVFGEISHLAGDKKKAVAIHSFLSFRDLAILFFQKMTNSTKF
jgi:hypothetical protein